MFIFRGGSFEGKTKREEIKFVINVTPLHKLSKVAIDFDYGYPLITLTEQEAERLYQQIGAALQDLDVERKQDGQTK